ncbi:MAG TPA: hypothetical protein VMR76_01010 [Candidatus Saccharimonadia bacterium]|nr:hypothetical protein [Candidatus Saccharimonadia bacterium]
MSKKETIRICKVYKKGVEGSNYIALTPKELVDFFNNAMDEQEYEIEVTDMPLNIYYSLDEFTGFE